MVEAPATTTPQNRDHCVELLIIQPTPFCNLDCAYCYLPHRNDSRRLSGTTLSQLCSNLFDSPYIGQQLTIIWHAGEPMVLPVDYYREAFGIIQSLKPDALTIQHSFQTNGTLIDEVWLQFIQETGLRIGVSIDGFPSLHDRYRKTRKGTGTYDATLAGIHLLQSANVDFHVITVLTHEALHNPDALFDFYVEQGIRHVCFNVEEIEGPHVQSSLSGTDIDARYKAFMRRFIAKLSQFDSPPFTVREFADAFQAIMSPVRPPYNPQTNPLAIVSVGANGQLSTFSPELLGNANAVYGDFVYGHAGDSCLDRLLENPHFQLTWDAIRVGVRHCEQQCAYFPFCGGGAPANKLFENGGFDTTETLYCRLTKKALLDIMLEFLEAELDKTPLWGI